MYMNMYMHAVIIVTFNVNFFVLVYSMYIVCTVRINSAKVSIRTCACKKNKPRLCKGKVTTSKSSLCPFTKFQHVKTNSTERVRAGSSEHQARLQPDIARLNTFQQIIRSA